MFMADPKKKAATLIISKMGQSSEAPKSELGDEMDQSAGFDAAAEEILSAVESKDAQALKAALKSFHEMCMCESPESEEESES